MSPFFLCFLANFRVHQEDEHKKKDNFISEMPSPRIIITKANSILYFYLRKANEKNLIPCHHIKISNFLIFFLFACRWRIKKKDSPGKLHALLLLCLIPSYSLVISRVVLIANERKASHHYSDLTNQLSQLECQLDGNRFLPKSRGEKKEIISQDVKFPKFL